jgi:16S rRNA (guanine966-N2)-methyltransferase
LVIFLRIFPTRLKISRKLLQNGKNITELLNVCYISMNTLDILKKKNKIVLSKKGIIMRIISGKARGTKLYTLEGENTRPTLDRVKESIFNIIQQDIPQSVFLDLFSGSGAMGLEAISRGARKAIMCDKSKEAIKVIQKNVEKTRFHEKSVVLNMDFKVALENEIHEKLDIVYLDPPYKTDYIYKAIKIMLEKNLIDKSTKVIVETDEEERVIQELKDFDIKVVDKRKYGRAQLIFLEI